MHDFPPFLIAKVSWPVNETILREYLVQQNNYDMHQSDVYGKCIN